MKKFLFVLILCLYVSIALSQTHQPVDAKASNRTKILYQNLFRVMHDGIMFGHQDDVAYGTGWMLEAGKSDVKAVVNDYPAVYGFDIGYIEKFSPHNIDSVPFNKMQELIKTGYERGGVITISWHATNPYNGKSMWDVTHGSVASVLPGGNKHELFKQWLHTVATFIKSLKSYNGDLIPVLFRPFHECNSGWFWWGKGTCSNEEYKALWRLTVTQLRDEEQVHNILYVYNTTEFGDKKEYEERYPGNEYVDVVSFDSYQNTDMIGSRKDFIKNNRIRLSLLTEFARNNNKLPAFSETGYENLPDANWYTKTLYETIKDFPVSYVLVWRNGGKKSANRGPWQYQPNHSFYTPTLQHLSAQDFKTFHDMPNIIFQNKITMEKLYY
jgi:hypothetical protein